MMVLDEILLLYSPHDHIVVDVCLIIVDQVHSLESLVRQWKAVIVTNLSVASSCYAP